MLQQHSPVCMVSYGKVTVVKVPMDINTFVQDRPRSSPTMPVSKDLARCLRMPDKYAVNSLYIIVMVLAKTTFTERGDEVCL